ncbi:MAG: DNA/RNA non-specific endonuclease [Muribaculaceae bacterium]|nr:DNA/RNA non-specific endonuclease [Muribaculaceae bacterium]
MEGKNRHKYHDIKHIVIMCLWVLVILACVALVVRRCACRRAKAATVVTVEHKPLYAGWLKVTLPQDIDNTTITYSAFTVHFNPTEHIANCVAYELSGEHTTGTVGRYKRFECDFDVKGCALPEYYSRSGYDRGHLAPAGDFKWDATAMRQTFLMTNVCPQNHSLNEGMWHKLEKKVREWAVRDSLLIVVAGPVPETHYEHTERGEVAIPQRFFKVVSAPKACPARTIAFVFNNEPCRGSLKEYAVSVDSLEKITGFDFHAGLPADMQAAMESECDYSIWLTN